MAFDTHLADRVHILLQQQGVDFYTKKMFGGLCFMVEDKMCVGILKDALMARVGPAAAQLDHAPHPGARDMDFTGRPMKGYLFIDPIGTDQEADLSYWVQLCLAFSPEAKASRKRKPRV